VNDAGDAARDVLAGGDRYAGSSGMADRERSLAAIANFGDAGIDAPGLNAGGRGKNCGGRATELESCRPTVWLPVFAKCTAASMIPCNVIELCASAGGAVKAALIVSGGNSRCLKFISSPVGRTKRLFLSQDFCVSNMV
jgi:hypothetical protein